MSKGTAERVAGSFPDANIFYLTGLGEPLLNPEFARIVAVFRRENPRAMISTTTNGFLLDADRALDIIGAGLNRFVVSLDSLPGFDAGVDGHPASEAVVRNVETLARIRGTAVFGIQSLLNADAESELKRVIDFAAAVGADGVNLVRVNHLWRALVRDFHGNEALHPRPGLVEENAVVSRLARHAAAKSVKLSFFNNRSLAQTMAIRLASRSDNYCLRLDSDLFIDVDGFAAVCCALPDERLGQVHGPESVRTLWRSDIMNAFRKGMPICSACDLFKVGMVDGGGKGL